MDAGLIEVFVEIPRGSRNKYEIDKERGVLTLDRVLYSSVHYPTDYGFVVDTTITNCLPSGETSYIVLMPP